MLMVGNAEHRQIGSIQEEQGEENRVGRKERSEDSETQHRYERKGEGIENRAEGEIETLDRKDWERERKEEGAVGRAVTAKIEQSRASG